MAVLPFFDLSKFEGNGFKTLEWLQYVGCLETRVFPEHFEKSLEKVKKISESVDLIVDTTTGLSIEECVKILNAGALAILVDEEVLQELSDISPSRLIFKTNTTDIKKIEELCKFAGSFQWIAKTQDYPPEFFEKASKLIRKSVLPAGGNRMLYLEFPVKPSVETLASISLHSVVPVVTSEYLTVNSEAEPDKLHLSDMVMIDAKTDRKDGLYSTLVVNELGVALGLVYSSKESVAESLKTGTGVYQSRKRGLWYKGATSGAVQKLLRIDLDCDGDCLRFIVHQTGKGFCHLDTLHCFGHASGLPQLESVLTDRKENAPEGSYTARLFSDPKLLRAKIMEEAEELCDAKTKDEVTWEMADLLYFAITRCVGSGVTLEDISRHLDLKHRKVTRRKGDAKKAWEEKLKDKGGVANTESS
ncbi:phosphoribosyl-AMP cyclohydrolase/phosphoribosyl- ATP pyrophosphohydrolase His7 [Schizosaccharomyces osmophilus]|uniref:Phosphoribosyl-AMP cyclohydrolase/phosphoribosyl- ATP pyrophosphohydrolase His7 n=1 Tax=Schizosaccharomyces osmophilus TaxID=2545709 RepID=A0AAE9WA97_9SCHI|nr:phosphoribosyl-AMP cyclohydrolase/phosphoribosyl- ATP pyrophosphohydrolase His7 [Schizosaccharomyces osmophilus]WBW72581.1 phosphoribosyl-AMP cyclohydrolase/phosphoribosyl- ATP pyrophosphohydrolase His7 [Schizosaccharomyces osmophilus]